MRRDLRVVDGLGGRAAAGTAATPATTMADNFHGRLLRVSDRPDLSRHRRPLDAEPAAMFPRRVRARGRGRPGSGPALRRRSDRSARRQSAKTSTVATSTSRASDSRSSARARNSRVRTVAAGIARHSAVSSHAHVLDFAHDEHRAERHRQLVDPALEEAAHLAPQQVAVDGDSLFSSRTSASGCRRRRAASLALAEGHHDPGRACCRRSRISAWLTTMRVSQVLSWARRGSRRGGGRRRDRHPAARPRPRRRP